MHAENDVKSINLSERTLPKFPKWDLAFPHWGERAGTWGFQGEGRKWRKACEKLTRFSCWLVRVGRHAWWLLVLVLLYSLLNYSSLWSSRVHLYVFAWSLPNQGIRGVLHVGGQAHVKIGTEQKKLLSCSKPVEIGLYPVESQHFSWRHVSSCKVQGLFMSHTDRYLGDWIRHERVNIYSNQKTEQMDPTWGSRPQSTLQLQAGHLA